MYSATVGSIKRALAEGVTLALISRANTASNTYQTIYQTEMDLTQLNKVGIGFDLTSAALSAAWCKVIHNGVTLYEVSVPGAGGGVPEFTIVDLVAGTTKVLGVFQVQIKNGGGVSTIYLGDCQMYGIK